MKAMIAILVMVIGSCLLGACGTGTPAHEVNIVAKTWDGEARITSSAQEVNLGSAYVHADLVSTGAHVQVRVPQDCGDDFSIGSVVSVFSEQLNSNGGRVAEHLAEPDIVMTMRCAKRLTFTER